MREFTVYCLYDIRYYNVFYVGATYRTIIERFKEHLRKRGCSSSMYINKDNKKYIKYCILEKCDCLDDLYDREYYWTEYYRNFFNLCNLDSGKLHNKSFFDKVSGKNNVKYGTHLTQEQKDRISKKLTGRKIPRDIVEKSANSRRGKHHSEEWCKNISNSLRGKEIAKAWIKVRLINTGEIFKSIKSAEEKYGVPSTHISACCKGKRKSAGKDKYGRKLIWQYVN